MKPSVPHDFVRREAAAFAALAREIEDSLSLWTERYPLFDQARVPAVALTAAIHLPDLSAAGRALAAAISLWIIAFDDVVDQSLVSRPSLNALTSRYMQVLDGAWPSDATEDQLGRALAEIMSAVRGYAAFAWLQSLVRARFGAFVQGVVTQRNWGAAHTGRILGTLPSYESHMAIARESIGVPFYLTICYVLYDDVRLVARIPHLLRAGDACATAIRLANDLRTWRKEDREQTFNTLAALEGELQRAQPELDPAARRQRALESIEERLTAAIVETEALLSRYPGADGSVEAGIGRLTRFVTGFYAQHDYHEYVAG